jgi:hypothetical protein
VQQVLILLRQRLALTLALTAIGLAALGGVAYAATGAGAGTTGGRSVFTALPSTTPFSQLAPAAAAAVRSTDWLGEINRYRVATGLAPVADQPVWDAGILSHLTYLEKTPASEKTGAFASAHTENPASPFYTPAGALEAGNSDLALGNATSPVAAIDVWWRAPFHAIGMLRASLTQVGLATDAKGYAGLDVIQGMDGGVPPATTPILFPGPGVTTNLATFGGESPSPLETCGWPTTGTAGLPLIAMLPQAAAQNLSASLTGPGGVVESSANGGLCIVDSLTFKSSDPVYGQNGAMILGADNAVILVPRRPLVSGTYKASIQQPAQPGIAWSFAAAITPPPAAFGWSKLHLAPRTITDCVGATGHCTPQRAKFSFALNARALVELTLSQKIRGKLRMLVGITVQKPAGRDSFTLSQDISGHRIPRGTYLFGAQAWSSSGHSSHFSASVRVR